MSDAENLQKLHKDIVDKIVGNKTEELKALLSANKIKADFVDEDGMTPLQHACYRGNKEMVQMFLDQGVDVNKCQHENGYTALHFAGLSGNPEVCHLLMSHGAKLTATNSIGRTAAQMSSFVGNYACVVAMNNFVPKTDIDYYIKPQGFQRQAMLHPHLADSFYSFIMQSNISPVRVIMNLQKYPGLIENLPMIQKVLEAMRQREITRGTEANEIISFKYHYLSSIVGELIKCQKRQEAMKAEKNDKEKVTKEKNEEKKTDVMELLIKKFLKCKPDGTLEYQELFLRDTLREFQYRECTIFRHMVASLASPNPPSAMSVIAATINGQRGFSNNEQYCITCGEENPSKKCSKCKMVHYCDRECQRLHWFIHKKTCTRLSQSITSNAKVPDPNSDQFRNTVVIQ